MNDDEKAEALEQEVTDMLSALPGKWRIDIVYSYSETECFAAVRDNRKRILTASFGSTKAEALEGLLENWRKGQSEPYAPAAGSVEELRLKLAVMKG